MAEVKQIKYGRSLIEYKLVREARRNLSITVQPDKVVVVRAPLSSSQSEIDQRLIKRGKWVLNQINYFDQFHPLQPEREYVGGETHYYLGRQYRLHIEKELPETVKLVGKFFEIRLNNSSDRSRVRMLLQQWYADHARLQIEHRARKLINQVLGSNFADVSITYNFLKKRWGICKPDGSITFNVELIKTPVQCVDYVIVHELCHLKHPNHDKSFYSLLETVLPDWRQRKQKLELFGLR